MAYMTPTNMLSIYVDVHKFHNWQRDTQTRTHTHTTCRLFLRLCIQRAHISVALVCMQYVDSPAICIVCGFRGRRLWKMLFSVHRDGY